MTTKDNEMRIPAIAKNAYTAFKIPLKPGLYLILDIIVQQAKSYKVTANTIYDLLDQGIWKNHIYARLKQLKSQDIIVERDGSYHVGPALMHGINLWFSRRNKPPVFSKEEIDNTKSDNIEVPRAVENRKCKKDTTCSCQSEEAPVLTNPPRDETVAILQMLVQQVQQIQLVQQQMQQKIDFPTAPVKVVESPKPVVKPEPPKPAEEINPYELVKNALKDPEVTYLIQTNSITFNRTDDGSIDSLVYALFGGSAPLEEYRSNNGVIEALIDTLCPETKPKGLYTYFWRPERFYTKSNWDYESWRDNVANAIMGSITGMMQLEAPATKEYKCLTYDLQLSENFDQNVEMALLEMQKRTKDLGV